MRNSGRRRDDRRVEEEGGGAPEWMTTYGDLMSLLLCFFVLIVSFSSIQMVEFQKALGSLKGALGVMPHHTSPINPADIKIPILTGFAQWEFEDKLNELNKEIEKVGLSDSIQVEFTKQGIAIRMDEAVLFDLGKAELKSSSFVILEKIGALLKRWPNSIRIEGHTDNLPIKTVQFPSNWELSSARAINVLHYLEENSRIKKTKLYPIAYGDTRPLVPNNSYENRGKNRRVEIYLEK